MNDINTSARVAENAARAKRLQSDWAIREGLITLLAEAMDYAIQRAPSIGLPMTQIVEAYLWGRMVGRFGKEGEQVKAMRELISRYDYLDNLTDDVFGVDMEKAAACFPVMTAGE